ncbi:MAG: hypothetical protein ACXAC7_20120 [Candidatus Hodarchaeales archaeon]
MSTGNLTDLEEFYLVSNKFTSFPETMENLFNLKRLDLRGVKLSTLPENIRNLKIRIFLTD